MKRSGLDDTECGEVHLMPCICSVAYPEQEMISKYTLACSENLGQHGCQNHTSVEASKAKILQGLKKADLSAKVQVLSLPASAAPMARDSYKPRNLIFKSKICIPSCWTL